MSNLELRIEEEANLGLTISDSSDMSFDAVDFVGVPFAPTVEVEDIEGGHRVSITSMGAEGKKTDEFDVMDGADGATGPQGPKGDSYEITAADYAEIAEVVEGDIQDVIDAAQDATADATAAAAEARAASAATWLSGNVLFGELAEGTLLTADDVYAAPPKGVEVYGKSTQDGTPTPDAPVEIKSVDDLTLNIVGKNYAGKYVLQEGRQSSIYGTVEKTATGFAYTSGSSSNQNGIFIDHKCLAGKTYVLTFTANTSVLNVRLYETKSATVQLATITNGTAFTPSADGYVRIWVSGTMEVTNLQLEVGSTATTFEPYVGQSVEIPLSDHVGRSLPDGTRDTLTLTYQGPSTRSGWAWYSGEVTRAVGDVDMGELTWGNFDTNVFFANVAGIKRAYGGALCSAYRQISAGVGSLTNGEFTLASGGNTSVWFRNDDCTTAAEFAAAVSGVVLDYKLATPTTETLPEIELPILPAPDLTAWADGGSAQPTMALEYERALSIVIPRIEAAISDLATS